MHLESTEGIKYSTIIDKNNSADFTFKPNISDVYFMKYSRLFEDFIFPIFVQPGANIKIEIDKQLRHFKFTGDQLAKELNSFYSGLKKYDDAYKEIQNKIDGTKDYTGLAILNIKISGNQ